VAKGDSRTAQRGRTDNGTVILELRYKVERGPKQDHDLLIQSLIQNPDETVLSLEIIVVVKLSRAKSAPTFFI